MTPLGQVGQVAAGPERRSGSNLLEQLRLLWPEPARVSLTTRRHASKEARLSFVPLPAAGTPRMLVPAGPPRVTASAIRGSRVARDRRARWATSALSGAARMGLLRWHPHRIQVEGDDSSWASALLPRLREAVGTQVVPSFYVGPVRAVQKPVLQLLDPTGRTVAFAKVGVNDLTNALVASEARALDVVGGHAWSTLRTPRLLMHERWHDHEVIVQSALPSDGPATAELVSRALGELAATGDRRAVPLGSTSWWADIVGRVTAFPDGAAPEALRQTIASVDAAAGSVSVFLGPAHLDWAPWNMSRVGDALAVWDWEQFCTAVPVGYDAIHFALQQAVVLRQQHPVAAVAAVRREAPQLMASLGLHASRGDLLVLLYLLELASRYLRDGESGTRLSRLHTWVEPVLASFDVTTRADGS